MKSTDDVPLRIGDDIAAKIVEATSEREWLVRPLGLAKGWTASVRSRNSRLYEER